MWFLLLACVKSDPVDSAPPVAPLGIALESEGWLRGDLHVHTLYSDGFDDVATVVGLAEYLEDPVFLAAHPEFEGNGLDFMTLTDHRTVDQLSDPAWASERMVRVGGEEFGSRGHAGLHGVSAFVDHDPDGEGTTLADIEAAVSATHAQGAIFSPNHPLLPRIPWPWDLRDHDGVEIWNAGWGLMSPPFAASELEEWEAENGAASPLFHRAIQDETRSNSDQTLVWYEAQLARGMHKAMIGGSDRHAVLLPGFPTTWVKTDAVSEAGVVDGIRARHTFISRSPVSAQVLFEIEHGGQTYGLGDAVPAAGQTLEVTVRVGRADGAKLRIIGGSAVDSDEALASAPLGTVLYEETVVGDDFELSFTLDPAVGDWFYPVVLEPLIAPGLSADEEAVVRALAVKVAATESEDFVGLAEAVADLTDPRVIFEAENCDPEDWEALMMQCFPVDEEGIASFYVPDALDRAMNVVIEGGELTEWAMGALGSAVLIVE